MTRRPACHVTIVATLAVSGGVLAGTHQRFTTSIDLARFELTVENNETPIGNLAAADFEVADAGVRIAEVSVREFSDASFDMMLIVQPFTSHNGDQLPLFDVAVRSVFNGIRPSDRFGVVVAGRPPSRPRPLADGGVSFDKAALAGTPHAVLYDAIGAALSEFDGKDRRKIVLVVSDGVDRLSVLSADMLGRLATRSRPRVAFLGASPTLVDGYTIRSTQRAGALDSQAEVTDVRFRNSFPGAALRAVAEATGGQIVDLRGREPTGAVAQLLTRLRSGYMLTFPASPAKGWHPVTVKVKTRKAHLTTRAGYFVD